MSRYREIMYKGKTFNSVADFARHYGMDPKLVLGRIHRGKSPAEAISRTFSNHVSVKVGDKEFPSIAEACRHYGLDQKLVQGRLKKGWSAEESFGLVKRARPDIGNRGRKITVFGETFPSLKLLAHSFDVSIQMIQHRVRVLGMSYEEAVSFKKVREVTCYDTVYTSIADLAKAYSVNPGTLVSRIRRGMSTEQAVSAPVQEYQPNKPGVIYLIRNLVTQKQYVGLTRSNIKSRLASHFKAAVNGRGQEGSLHEAMRTYPKDTFTIEEIARAESSEKLQELEQFHIEEYETLAPHGYNQNIGGASSGGQIKKGFRVGCKSFESFAEACRFYEIDEGTCMNRLKRGWSTKKAFTEEVQKFKNGKKVEVFGVLYSSLKEASEKNNADYKKVFYHVKYMNESAEEAIRAVAGKSRKVIVDGVEYAYMKDACKAYSVKVGTVIARMKNQSMTLEQALKAPKKKNKFG